MTIKTLLVVLIFTALGMIIIGGGVIIMKYHNSAVNNKTVKPAN